jgi:hypothetical protein
VSETSLSHCLFPTQCETDRGGGRRDRTLAGAQAVDEAEVYTHGLPSAGPVPLDAAAAEEAATAYVAALGIAVDDVRVQTTATTVSVQIVTRYRLPVSSTVTMGVAGEPVVDASATARTAVMP